MSDITINQLLTALRGEAREREAAQAQLVAMGAAVVEPLIAMVTAAVGREARAAAEVLGEIGDERAFQPLVTALRSDNLLLAGSAVVALEKYKAHDVVAHFLEALPQVRIMTQQSLLLALQRAGDHKAVAPLLHLLQTAESPVLRVALIKVLGELGDATILPTIHLFVNDEDHHVRDWAQAVITKFAS